MTGSPRLSRRTDWDPPTNLLARAREERNARGLPLLDLTESNPTRAGIDYPLDELEELLGRGGRASYRPDPLGLRSGREAVAEHLSTPADPVSPDEIVLTASTSEAYGFLFKLFASPGEELLTPAPTYPLLDALASLESLRLRHVPTDFEGRWRIDPHAVRRELTERTRLLVVVHPNNPTGAYLGAGEQEELAQLAAEREIAFVSDEVFLDYPLEGRPDRAPSAAANRECTSLSLGGLSKSAGLPHFKLGWIRIGGPEGPRRRIVSALELIADNWLSIATPVQEALPGLLRLAPRIRASISARCRRNLERLDHGIVRLPAVDRLPVEGGWSALLRVPALKSDEELALELLGRGLLVHPGFFFDFAADGWIVLSLLTPPETFDAGLEILVEALGNLG